MLPYIIGGAVAVSTAVIGFISGSVYRRKSAEATIGSAEDGTMTQKAIKTELDKKVGVTIDSSNDMLIFTI